MAVELATAYIALVPSLKGASQKISQELGSVDTASAGSEMGRKMGGGMVSSIKSLVGPAIGLLATGAFAGFIKDAAAASDATDKFKATMSFAGMDTSAITKAKDAAKQYADQTVYDLPTIQNMTAQLASNGVKDYTGLTQAAGNLNAVAGGNAETFKSVAMVMTQTAGAGKLTTENWNQMADAIPGAAGPLMKSLQEAGAYTGNFRDAMAAGQISSDEFNASLMKLGNDPVAVEAAKSTKTFEGAIGSLQATINSGLMSALDALKPGITGAISGLSSGLGSIFAAFGAIYNLFKTGDFTGAIGKALGVEEDSKIVDVILTIRDGVIGAFNGIKSALSGIDFGAIFGGLVSIIGPLIPQFMSLFSSMSPIQTIFAAIQPMLPQLLDVFMQLASVVGGTLSTALTTLMPVFTQLQGVFISVFQQVLATALPVIVQLVTMLGQTFTQLMPILLPIITMVVSLAATLISQLAPIFIQLVSTVLPMVVTIFGAILGAIGPLISMLAGILIPIIQMLMPVVVTVFGVIANVIGTVMQIIMGIIQVVMGIISGNWGMVWEGIVNIFSGIWNTIVALVTGVFAILWAVISSGLNAVFSFIGDVLGNIGKFFSDVWNNILSFMGDVWNNIVNGVVGYVTWYFTTLSDGFNAVWNFIVGLFTSIGQFFSDTWNNIVNGVVGYVTWYFTTIFDGFNAVWNFIVSILGNIGQFFADTWNNIVNGVVGFVTWYLTTIINGFNAVLNFIGSILGNIGQFFADTWSNVNTGIANFVGGIGNAFAGVSGAVKGAFSSAGTWLLQAGKDIVQGVIDGVGSMVGAIGKAILDLVPGPVVGVFKAALGIASPSKVFRGFGKNIVEGLILGTGDKTDDLSATMRGLVAVPNVPAFGAPSASIAGSGRGGSGATFNTTINQVDDPIGTAHAVTRRQLALSS